MHGLLVVVLGLGMAFLAAVVRQRWSSAAAKEEEVLRFLGIASPMLHQCAVCCRPTTMRCSRCKSLRYCSGKCQIAHWRQGHKDECHYFRVQFERMTELCRELDSPCEEESTGFASASALSDLGDDSSSRHIPGLDASNKPEKRVSDEPNLLGSSTVAKSPSSGYASSVNCVSDTNKSNRMESDHADGKVKSSLQFPNAKIAKHSDGLPATNRSSKKLTKATPVAEKLTKDLAKSKSMSSTKDEHKSCALKSKDVHASPSIASYEHQSLSIENTRNGLKTSVRKVVQQFRASKQSKIGSSSHGSEISRKHKLIFPYEVFVRLFTHDAMLLGPFGLTNCGNSCYANAVLQCLVFTRPFTSYLLQGLHAKACRKKDWCFVCELEYLIQKSREGTSSLSPIRILSKLHKIGIHLGHGKEEDAHEFLRYAVDTIQSVFLHNAGAMGPLAEESTLVGMTFGGYLLSKIKCMRCLGKSEHCERMMDLTVEIDGEIDTLEEALAQFTATETLDRDNKYHCIRCKSYEKAKKKLTILEAPNILTIALKRFKSGNFEKLSKSVQFPEVLDITPYMSRTSDRPPLYSLYAVVVHLDVRNASFSGHYVCHVKNALGKWFKIDDSTVQPVQIERVLSEGAYILLYARRSPRPPAMLGGDMVIHMEKSKTINFGKSKSRSDSIHRVRGADSSSECSSIFSSSDASSSSTVSTKDYASNDDLSDYIFGAEAGPSFYRRQQNNSPQQSGWELEKDVESSRQHRKSSSLFDHVLWPNPFDVIPPRREIGHAQTLDEI